MTSFYMNRNTGLKWDNLVKDKKTKMVSSAGIYNS